MFSRVKLSEKHPSFRFLAACILVSIEDSRRAVIEGWHAGEQEEHEELER